jgi:hypothetical protein
VERAYRRGDLFAKRVALMDDWAHYLAQPAAEGRTERRNSRPRRIDVAKLGRIPALAGFEPTIVIFALTERAQ